MTLTTLRKNVLFFCLALLSLFLLAACGEGNSSSNNDTPDATTSEDVGHSPADDVGQGNDPDTDAAESGDDDATVELPSCTNDKLDGDETDIDCGGTCPSRCAIEQSCQNHSDCQSGVCGDDGECVAPAASCANHVKDENESDVDCGGENQCPRCIDGKHCASASDCQGNICNASGWCESHSCSNTRQDLGETDIDCGGLFCDPCALGKKCGDDGDCESAVCTEGICHPQSCTDGRRNQDETDIDCGGSCATKCAKTQACLVAGDCALGLTCLANICVDLEDETSTDARVQSQNDVAYSYLMTSSDWMLNGRATFSLGRQMMDSSQYTSIHTALRFANVRIPRGATITSAYIYWYPHNEVDSNKRLRQNIYAEKTGNSMPFNFSNYESDRPDQRSKTSASIKDWIVRCIDNCNGELYGESYCALRELDCWNRNIEYQVPKDLKALVQEVIELPEWNSGNAMTFFFVNVANDNEDTAEYKGHRSVTGYDPDDRGIQFAPRLAVEFDPPVRL
ncbi:MAG: hypothetical protein LBM75_05895 [Myxococcales bacterium]|nr:hypothetical protein [Myxococcales bacterium]